MRSVTPFAWDRARIHDAALQYGSNRLKMDLEVDERYGNWQGKR